MPSPDRKEIDEPWRLPATRIAALVRAGKLSAVDATRSALDRLQAVNPPINAVVECRPDEALARAREIDEMRTSGSDPGALAGVPITLKVNVDQK